MVGTPLYMAPEIYQQKKPSYFADIYSYGLIMYALFLELEPFCELKDLPTEKFWEQKIKLALSFPDNISEPLLEFINKLTAQDSEERPTFEEILQQEMLFDAIEFKGDDKFRSIWEELEQGGREKVHLIELVYKFYEKYEYLPGDFEKVKGSLCYKIFNSIMQPYESHVNVDGFTRFVNLLQPLEDEGKYFMKRAETLLKKKAFGDILERRKQI